MKETTGTLFIVHVDVHVEPEAVQAFADATLMNARASLNEPGVVRFDVIWDREEPTRFVLVEIYRSAEDAAAHKETAHYLTWRDTVAPLMAEPRRARKFVNLHPADTGYRTR